MNGIVKPKRRYSSTQRARQALDTRNAILEAARRRFIGEGWSKTTIAAIADDAQVSNETVYAVFGNKRAILSELVMRQVRGTAPEVPLLEQAGPQRVLAARDQRDQLRVFASGISDVLSRAAPMMAVVREAAMAELELRTLYADLHAGRRRNLAFVVDALLANGPLRHGVGRDMAVAILWRLASPELFLLMRDIEAIALDDYAGWLAGSLERQLLQG